MPMRIGKLRERVVFDAPHREADGSGGSEQGWRERVRAKAHFRYLRGGETVQAARLEGRQPVVVTVHANAATRQITTDWRMRDLTRETVDGDGIYAVKAPPVLSDNRLFLEITCESGVAL